MIHNPAAGESEIMGDREKELTENGWTRQFEACEPRLGEAVRLYEEMGFAVRLEPLDFSKADENSDDCKSCRACFKGQEENYRIIFTKKTPPPWRDDELSE